MGLFNNNKKKRDELPSLPELPELPEMPELQELPDLEDEDRTIHQLPIIPSSSFGERFSQNAIKEAISGKKEDELRGLEADEFVLEDMQKMQTPLKKKFTKELEDYEEDIPQEDYNIYEKSRNQQEFEPKRNRIISSKKEQIFVRIDKFEESIKTFEETLKKVNDIRKTLEDIKRIKEKEQQEINSWEKEIQEIKRKLDKIDEDIFSKV